MLETGSIIYYWVKHHDKTAESNDENSTQVVKISANKDAKGTRVPGYKK